MDIPATWLKKKTQKRTGKEGSSTSSKESTNGEKPPAAEKLKQQKRRNQIQIKLLKLPAKKKPPKIIFSNFFLKSLILIMKLFFRQTLILVWKDVLIDLKR